VLRAAAIGRPDRAAPRARRLRQLVCHGILERFPAGDHCAFLLDPFHAESHAERGHFTFHRARRLELGHEA